MTRRDRYYRRAHERLSRQNKAMVAEWANTTLWATQAGLDGYQATADRASLLEALDGATGLLAAVEVLLDKEDGRNPN